MNQNRLDNYFQTTDWQSLEDMYNNVKQSIKLGAEKDLELKLSGNKKRDKSSKNTREMWDLKYKE